MVQQSLIDYVKTLLKQGYDISTIRSTLRGAGYTHYDIQEALAEAQKPQVIHTKTLIMAFIAVLVLALAVVIALKLMQPSPTQLEMSLKTYQTQAEKGGQIVMTANIENPNKKETSAILDLSVSGPTKIEIPSETIAVYDRTAIPIAITIPEDGQIGQYLLTAKLNYDQKTTTATQYFEVVQKTTEKPAIIPKTEEQAKIQQQCPTGCDDLDQCTKDECVEGQCKHTPITPCCGNKICEQGEQGTCADCKESKTEEAKKTAKTDPEKAAEICSQSANRDQCYKELAETSGQKKFCDLITETKWKDPCLMNFAYKGDYTVCTQIQNRFMKNSCNSLKNLHKG